MSTLTLHTQLPTLPQPRRPHVGFEAGTLTSASPQLRAMLDRYASAHAETSSVDAVLRTHLARG